MNNKDQSAFPFVASVWSNDDKEQVSANNYGLSKREYFAAKALIGIMSNATCYQGYSSYAETAAQAVAVADALLTELEKL